MKPFYVYIVYMDVEGIKKNILKYFLKKVKNNLEYSKKRFTFASSKKHFLKN